MKTLNKILTVGSLAAFSAGVFGGCAEIYKETVGKIEGARAEAKREDKWKGTAVVWMKELPTGDLVFCLDSQKVDDEIIWSDYANRFLDMNKYKLVKYEENGPYGFIVTYSLRK